MEIFQFKQFAVRNERSSMKVNTDGVLLGAAMTLRPSDRLLLDIGTGTGVIALMAAQRLADIFADGREWNGEECPPSICDKGFSIIGIDIDEASAAEVAENFASSPWSEKLAAKHISLSDFEKECDGSPRVVEPTCDGEAVCTKKWYNHIFSNPPYFESSLKSPDERKRTARHAETMSYREIIAFAANHLTPAGHLAGEPDCNEGQHPAALPSETDRAAGHLSMILPYETEREAVRYAASFNLRLFRRLRIRTTPSRPLSRVLLEFARNIPVSDSLTYGRTNEVMSEELTIQDNSGYTSAYRSLVASFLLI